MKSLIALFTICFLFVSPVFAEHPKVLMLISSYGTEKQPDLSYDLEELAQSYLVLHDNGVIIDIASPKGGAVLIKHNKDDLDYIRRFKELALDNLNNTLATDKLQAKDYSGVFIIGGGGAMMDLPFHAATQQLLTQFVHQEKVVTAVCHGPAAIVDIKMKDGSYFVANKQVNSFTNIEERAFSKENADLFKFLIEDKLNQNGAIFVNNKPMLPFVASDENLITAQNPSSVAKAAEATVLELGLSLQQRKLFKDEATMHLIAQARSAGTSLIDIALANPNHGYDLNYLALYGFYAYPLASEQDKKVELNIMEVIAKYFQHIEYDTALIQRLTEQNQVNAALHHLQLFQKRYPNHERFESLSSLITQARLNNKQG